MRMYVKQIGERSYRQALKHAHLGIPGFYMALLSLFSNTLQLDVVNRSGTPEAAVDYPSGPDRGSMRRQVRRPENALRTSSEEHWYQSVLLP